MAALKGKQKTQSAVLKKSGRITAGFLTSAAASVGTDPKDLIANNTPRSTLTKTTPMTDLSPAAAAVLRAAGDSEPGIYATIAAALRAAADQVVPHLEEPDWGAHNNGYCNIELYTDHQRKRAQLLAIADELDAH
jgi:hypothetical protein